ncbi:LCP family protein [Streptomyces alfalfae]|uniref:LytR C-terminal domain-containing protein n=1 Tax=Streptomyces alfalfae TaxID=1642299 RepID=UPI001BA9CD62|nr:LytR C-terminal domain-containing protein [Streptomyces alfalfae]QUI31710.1 LCP family protein [Streptomyces alfalfae]
MNDRQYDPYAGSDPYTGEYPGEYAADQYQVVGYDEYGRPVYQQVPQQSPQQQPHQTHHQQQQAPQYQQPQGYGYDPYGGGQQGHDANAYDANAYGAGAYGAGTYGAGTYDGGYGAGASSSSSSSSSSSYDGGAGTAYDNAAGAAGTAGAAYGAGVTQDAGWIPQQQQAPEPQASRPQRAHEHQQAPQPEQSPEPQRAPEPQQAPESQQVPRPRRAARGEAEGDAGSGAAPETGSASRRPQPEYETEQFSFIEEPDEDSEDVIDWLKFTESRTERREEAKRRGRSRVVALVVVLALVIAGGVGYLWFAGMLPGQSGDEGGAAAAGGPQKRDVVVVHLHNTKGGDTSTALLVNNATTGQGATVLIPNSFAVPDDNGSATTLGKSVDDDGSTGTRESIDTALGTEVEGTWRLDTPYLQNLVELVGNIDVDTDTDVPDPKAKKGEAPLVQKGEQQTLSGPMAVAYATHRAAGESETAQLNRFGQVMQGVLRKLSSDPQAATTTVESLAQILDPSLKEKDLGAFLAKLADRAKGGDYKTTVLPVRQDGTLTEKAGDTVVKDILGGAAKSPEQGAAVRVGVENASGSKGAAQDARVALVNGGYAFVDGGTGSATQPTSKVTYADAAKKSQATEVAKTLGLPTSAVTKGKTTANADVSVVLGQDYEAK